MRVLSSNEFSKPFTPGQFSTIAILVVLILATFFLRTYRLEETPPAFDYDEAAHAMDAVELLQGHHALYSPKTEGNTTFLKYLFAFAFSLLGVQPFVQRLFVVFCSTLTIPLTYALAVMLFRSLGASRARSIGILAAAGLATSYWHLNYSRIGLEINMVPFFAVLCFLFLWHGLESGRRWPLIASGFWLALDLYVYPGARFIPVFLALFFVYRWFAVPRDATRPFARQVWQIFGPLCVIGVTALVVYAPMLVFFASFPQGFVGRAAGTLFMNPRVNLGDPWGALWRGFIGNIGAFGFTSDLHAQANLAGKSILNPLLAVLFWVGMALSVYRFNKPPYAFCVLWWAVMIFPVIITPDRVPQYGRMMSLAPVTYILIALALEQIWTMLRRMAPGRWRAPGTALVLVVLVLFGGTAATTCRDYFVRWAPAEATYLAFSGEARDLARMIDVTSEPDGVFVVPCDAEGETECDYSYECNHFPLSFFHRMGGAKTDLQYVFMYEPDIPGRMTEIVRGKRIVHLVALEKGKRKFLYPEADPRNLLQFLLESAGTLERVEAFPYYRVLTYRLAADRTSFTWPAALRQYEVDFGGQLELASGAYGGAVDGALDPAPLVESGGKAWVLLKWELLGAVTNNLRASLRLVDADGHVIDQLDHVLFGASRQGTSQWTVAEAPVSDFYLLPIASTTPPGNYQLQIGLYTPALEMLPVGGHPMQVTASLGSLEVVAPDRPAAAAGEVEVAYRLDAALTPEIALLGHDLELSNPFAPGQKGTVLLYWHVTGSPARDLQWRLTLQDDGGTEWPLLATARPLGAGFPTSWWKPGEVWGKSYDFTVPPHAPSGSYHVVAQLSAMNGAPVGRPVVLGEIEIAGRPRAFVAPDVTRTKNTEFGVEMRLLGYDPSATELSPGSDIEIVLHWQALAEMQQSYTVFVHVMDGAQVVAQHDAVPGEGTLPTTGWLPGEFVSDRIVVPLPGDLQPGRYALVTGVYDAASGERLPVTDAAGQPLGDHLFLDAIIVGDSLVGTAG